MWKDGETQQNRLSFLSRTTQLPFVLLLWKSQGSSCGQPRTVNAVGLYTADQPETENRFGPCATSQDPMPREPALFRQQILDKLYVSYRTYFSF